MGVDKNKRLCDMTEQERCDLFNELLIEMHPKVTEVVESLDDGTFWWWYNMMLSHEAAKDFEPLPDDTPQRLEVKALARSIMERFKPRYEEEFVERNNI